MLKHFFQSFEPNTIAAFKIDTLRKAGKVLVTWWTFRIFFICLGRGKDPKGESEAPGGGDWLLIENSTEGGFLGAEGAGGCLQRTGEFGGGGVNIFFSGPKRPPRSR